MRFLYFILIFLSSIANGFCQYSFSGYVSDTTSNKTVYLSLIEDYRKVSRTYLEQIVRKTTTDSTGFFKFQGDNLLKENRIYKVHIDECSQIIDSNHFFGSCNNTKSILFIANVNDTLYFPTTFNNEIFCDVTSTNKASNALLNIDALKEEMIYDFSEFRSEANRKLNSKKWFTKLQEYGNSISEPLAELYIFEFLSDRQNETYEYYLKDIQSNSYYDNLLDRLQNSYPNTPYLKLYEAEINADRQLSGSKHINWVWILGGLLFLSLLANIYLYAKKNALAKNHQKIALKELTQQEQKIISLISKDNTNKEIASELFISVSTVKTHINNLYKKLNVGTREELKKRFQKS